MLAPTRESSKRKLVILDMNNVLVYRAFIHGLDEPDKPAGIKAMTKSATLLGKFYTWDRPGRREFISYCLDNFDVAVWSSAKQENVNLLCDFVFGSRRSELVFEWDQNACDIMPRVDQTSKPVFIKSLLRVKEAYGVDHWPDILMIDDSLGKMSGNPIGSYFIVDPWPPTETRDHITLGLAPESLLRRHMEQFRLKQI